MNKDGTVKCAQTILIVAVAGGVEVTVTYDATGVSFKEIFTKV